MNLYRYGQFAILALAAISLSGLVLGHPARVQPIVAFQPMGNPTSAPTAVEWDKSAKGVKIKYPGDWKPKTNPDYELMLIHSGTKKEDRITVDIPDLPPHLPFMIRMSRIEHDYVEDLKKEHPDLQQKRVSDVSLPDAQARLVESTWHANKQTYDDVVLLVIHASSVYIFDAQADDTDLTATRAAFDSIKASIQWTKR
jgi:hypothetical protein